MEVKEFCPDDVRGPVCTTQKVIILSFCTISVHTNTSVKGHCMWVHMLTEPMPGLQLPTAVVPMVTYGELHLGSSRVPICLCNLGTHSIQIPVKVWLDRSCLPTKSHQWSSQQGLPRNPIAIPKRDGSWRPWTSEASGSGLNLSKECYQCMPPHMYDDLRAHIQEMLEIGAIQKSHSLWASAGLLIWKKDGSPRFCIDLRKLNNRPLRMHTHYPT